MNKWEEMNMHKQWSEKVVTTFVWTCWTKTETMMGLLLSEHNKHETTEKLQNY